MNIPDWRSFVYEAGGFAGAEKRLLDSTSGPDTYGDETVTRAEFYEAWGDAAGRTAAALAAYREADRYFSMYASWSTSGGEGTARMMDVNRVQDKARELERKI